MEDKAEFFNPYFNFANNSDVNMNYKPLAPMPERTVPAMVYIHFQDEFRPFESEEGFKRGTLFPSLDKPFLGERGCNI